MRSIKHEGFDECKKLTGACVAVAMIPFIVGMVYHLSAENEPNLVIFLFAIPLTQLLSLYILWKKVDVKFYKFNMLAISVCIAGYSILWSIYSKNKSSLLLSIIAMILIVVLLIFVVVMTAAIMMSPRGIQSRKWASRFKSLRIGGKSQPWWSLSLSLSLFLGVSFLLGFAFAFHDKSQPSNNPALYMKNLYKPPPTSTSTTSAIPTPIPTPISSPPPFVFTFKSGSALCESNAQNDTNMANLLGRIKGETAEHNRIRVEVVGRADNTDTGRSYKSNYEIAEARAVNIKYKILKQLDSENDKPWRDIEWMSVSESNEPQDGKRIVNVFIEKLPQDPAFQQATNFEKSVMPHLDAEKPNSLTLMDYIYFANYTITTTGYGDIIPETAYAKFICSFANICEVFFLVVFVNALLSLRTDVIEHEMQEIESREDKVFGSIDKVDIRMNAMTEAFKQLREDVQKLAKGRADDK